MQTLAGVWTEIAADPITPAMKQNVDALADERNRAIAALKKSGMSAIAIARVIGGRVASDNPRAAPLPDGVKEIEKIVAVFLAELAREGWKLSAEDMRGQDVKRVIAAPRQVAMKIVRDILGGGVSLPLIGQYFGGRHHATVIHAITEGAPEHLRNFEGLTNAARRTMHKFGKTKSLTAKKTRG